MFGKTLVHEFPFRIAILNGTFFFPSVNAMNNWKRSAIKQILLLLLLRPILTGLTFLLTFFWHEVRLGWVRLVILLPSISCFEWWYWHLKIPKTKISSYIAPLAGVHKARFGCVNPVLRYAKPARRVLKPRVVEKGFRKPCFGTESPPSVFLYHYYVVPACQIRCLWCQHVRLDVFGANMSD